MNKDEINSPPLNYHSVKVHIHSDRYTIKSQRKHFWSRSIYCKQIEKVLFLWALDITFKLKEFQVNKMYIPNKKFTLIRE